MLLGLCIGSNPAAFAAEAQIEEIVVTAQKRESKLQETPIAITAITQEQISLNRIENFGDIALHTPSMSYTELQGFSQIAIRGVGTDLTNLANETAVAMYQDGVYQGATFAQTIPQFDMERIEVLRGPQGTLYGRNATGGAVNIITRNPSDVPEFNASLTGGDYARQRVELGASGPLADGISGRASFVTDSHSGYNDNHTLNDSEGDDSLKGGHVSVGFDLNDTTDLVLRANYTRDHGNTGVFMVREISPTALGISPDNLGGLLTFPQPALGGLSFAQVFGLTFPQAGQPIVVNPDNHDSYTEQPTKNNIKQYGGSGTLTTQLGVRHRKTDSLARRFEVDPLHGRRRHRHSDADSGRSAVEPPDHRGTEPVGRLLGWSRNLDARRFLLPGRRLHALLLRPAGAAADLRSVVRNLRSRRRAVASRAASRSSARV